MKNLVLLLALIATAVMAILYVGESQKVKGTKLEMEAAHQKIASLEVALAEAQSKHVELQEKLHTTREKAVAKAEEATHLQEELTTQEQAASKPASNIFAGMFKNKEMKNFVKTQQKTVVATMLDKNYRHYFDSAGFTPEQSTAVKDLLSKRQMIEMEAGMSLISEEPDKRKEIMDQAKKDKDAVTDELKAMLGDSYPQLEAYEKTLAQRMVVSGFRDSIGSDATQVTPEQEEQLVAAMADEKQKFKFTTDFSDQSKFNGDFTGIFTDEKLDQFKKESEELQANYISRAQAILANDQIESFQKYLKTQTEMQQLGLQMAKQMFGGKAK